jgi:DNA-binding CsgD family transcriptional regulator
MADDEKPLTIAQLEIVVHIANGLRVGEIARKTYRSESWVRQSLTAAQRRAGAKTIPHLISIVIASGVLEWSDQGERRIKIDSEASS